MSKTNYWDEIEEAFEEVDIYETYDVFKQGASRYPDWKIDLLAVHWTMSEIANGGLEQSFQEQHGNPRAGGCAWFSAPWQTGLGSRTSESHGVAR